jgi:hypothetical protein
MLIYLNAPEYPRESAAFIQWSKGSPLVLRFWERLAEVVRDGRHAVFAPKVLFDFANELVGLSDSQRHALREMGAALTEEGEHFLRASSPLVLTGPNGKKSELKHTTLKDPQRRDWTWFANLPDTFPRASLVAEDLDDAQWMLWVGRAMAARRRPQNENFAREVSLRCVAGGGESTGRALRGVILDGGPALCVVDSDKKHEGDAEGTVAQGARQALASVERHQRLPPHQVVVMRASAIENLMPSSLIEQACRDSGEVKLMARRGFFVQRHPDTKTGKLWATLDQSLKYIKLERSTANGLRSSSGADETAIDRIRTLDRDAPSGDDEPLVLDVGKLPRRFVEALERMEAPAPLTGRSKSAAQWLCGELLAAPDQFVAEWEEIAHAVWSWGLCFRLGIQGD